MKHHPDAPTAPQATPTHDAILAAPELKEQTDKQGPEEFEGVALPTAAELAELEGEDDGIEPWLEVADIARASKKFTEHTVRAHLKKLGIGEDVGGKIFICKYALQQRWRTMHLVLAVAALRGQLQKPERPKPTPPARKPKATPAPSEVAQAAMEGHQG